MSDFGVSVFERKNSICFEFSFNVGINLLCILLLVSFCHISVEWVFWIAYCLEEPVQILYM